MQSLTISLVQTDIHWENKEKNLLHFSGILSGIPKNSQVVVLPEMFSTGFSMHPEKLAEGMDGNTVKWMKTMALKHKKIITGSVIIKEDDRYFNRMIWMQPDGKYYHYDKRHLFSYASEDKHYTAGNKRLIVRVNGWKICLQVCYDLRFPVWLRQKEGVRTEATDSGYYDMLVFVASWPAKRTLAWKTLLQARAIENQCYVLGVNRVGEDGNGLEYIGDSRIIDPLGDIIWQSPGEASVCTHTFYKEDLYGVRAKFPFLNDADPFVLL